MFREAIVAMMDSIEGIARGQDLRVHFCDFTREVEALLFDMMRRENPEFAGEIEQMIALGQQFEMYPESAKVAVANIERDRDFLRSQGIQPHPSFSTIRPDEVAECWDGSDDLYQALWACVPDYKGPRPEVSEEPCIGVDCVKDFWHRFTDEQKQELNYEALRMEKEYGGW